MGRLGKAWGGVWSRKAGWRGFLPRLTGRGDAAKRDSAPRAPAHLHLSPPAWPARLARLPHPQGPWGPATASLTRFGPAAGLGMRLLPEPGFVSTRASSNAIPASARRLWRPWPAPTISSPGRPSPTKALTDEGQAAGRRDGRTGRGGLTARGLRSGQGRSIMAAPRQASESGRCRADYNSQNPAPRGRPPLAQRAAQCRSGASRVAGLPGAGAE